MNPIVGFDMKNLLQIERQRQKFKNVNRWWLITYYTKGFF